MDKETNPSIKINTTLRLCINLFLIDPIEICFLELSDLKSSRQKAKKHDS